MLIHWDVDGVWSSMSISVPVPAGGGFPGFPWAGILIVSFSFAWLCINFTVCSHCSDLVGLLARSDVMLALDSPMSPVDGSLSCGDSVSFPLPFSFLLWFNFGGWFWLWFVMFFLCVPSVLFGMGLSPNLTQRVLHSLWELAWFPLQLMHLRGVSVRWSSVVWSFALQRRHQGMVQLFKACENMLHLLHWKTWALFSYGVTMQL